MSRLLLLDLYCVASGEWNHPNVVKAECGPGGWGTGSRKDDAEFIAAARTLVPELVAEVERMRAVLADSQQQARNTRQLLPNATNPHTKATNV